MTELNNQENIRGWLKKMADAIGAKMDGATLSIPESLGKGEATIHSISESIFVVVASIDFKEEPKSFGLGMQEFSNRFYHITFFRNNDNTRILYDGQQNNSKSHISNGVIFASPRPAKDIAYLLGKQVRMTMLIFTPSIGKEIYEHEPGTTLRNLFRSSRPILLQSPLMPPINDVVNCLEFPKVSNSLVPIYQKGKALELLARYTDGLLDKYNDSFEFTAKTMDIKNVMKVRHVILSDLNAHPSIPELAAIATMSESKLHKTFKQVFGKSVYQYRLDARMDEARTLLLTRKYSVKDLGIKLGYSNISQFIKAFKKVYGTTPKSYLK